MADTMQSRGYAWALQADYQTQKAIAANALKQIIAEDKNLVDYEAQTQNDEEWSHGANSATDEWITAHDAKVNHTLPAFSEEMGKVFLLNLGDYSIETPTGATNAKEHVFKPQDPTISRQGKAVTYAEKTGVGWNVLMPSAVGNGFTLKGDGNGVLMLDFGLQGSGALSVASPVVWDGGTPSVEKISGMHKFFNTQVSLIVDDDGTITNYGCDYQSFEVQFGLNLLLEAGFKPGCARYLVDGDQTSGAIRSECLFDKQSLDFNFTVDMSPGSDELLAVQQQKPLALEINAEGGNIEGAINHKITVTIPVSKYKTAKPTEHNGLVRMAISGKAFFDFVTNKLFEIRLINDVANYATAF